MAQPAPRVLFAAAEIFPMAKTGGLGDVASALPAALQAAGADVRLIMPAYPSALAVVRDVRLAHTLGDFHGFGPTDILLGVTPHHDLPLYLVRNEQLFSRPGGPYHDAEGTEWSDNAERFALFSAATAHMACPPEGNWKPELVHLNDWHTAIVPTLLERLSRSRPATVFSIHNAMYQEPLNKQLADRYGFAHALPSANGDAPTFLRLGISSADYVTTVSPTYAAELQTPQFGGGLEGLIRRRAERLRGILNGIDYNLWDPATDVELAARYHASDLSGKSLCKTALLDEIELPLAPGTPLLACVSRLTWQKGLDILLEALPEVLGERAAFVLLGNGDAALETGFQAQAERSAGHMVVRIGYDEALAHRIISGADIFVMPSRFEPCGLNQMYSLHYGTIPVVHAVGGLADTVFDARSPDVSAQLANGFVTEALDPRRLADTLNSAISWYQDQGAWHKLQRSGMRQDFSWAKSAQAYLRVYECALGALNNG